MADPITRAFSTASIVSAFAALATPGQATPAVQIPGSIHLLSSPDGADSYDSTRRITLESYQRPVAGNKAAGEVIRILNKKPNAKSMTAIYFPQNPAADYDPVTNPMRTVASFWAGAHWHAQDDEDGPHGHYSFESPNVAQELQTRLSIDFASWDANNQIRHGGERIYIYTNKADFSFNAENNALGASDPNILRLCGSTSWERILEFSNSTIGRGSQRASGRRFQLVMNTTAESINNAGSNLALRLFSNSGTALTTAMLVERGTGNFGFGVGETPSQHMKGRLSARWADPALHGYYTKPSAALAGSAAHFYADAFAATDRFLTANVQGEANSRFYIVSNGEMRWGPGSSAQDIALARTAAGVLSLNSAPLGKKVSVPASVTTAGVPGDFAVSPTKAYFYTGDGAAHSWANVSLTDGI